VIALLLRAIREPHRRQVLVLLGAVVGVVLLGAGLFTLAEGLPYTTGLYWAVTSATTVGYGDITPHNPIGRLIASLVMLTAIPLLAGAFAIVSGAAAQRDQERAPGLVLGLVRDGSFTLGLTDDPVIAAGDRLLVAEGGGRRNCVGLIRAGASRAGRGFAVASVVSVVSVVG
jgi:hypothetical protein